MSHIRVGILETGSPPPPLQERFGSYAAMVQALLGRQHEFATFDVRNGELPQGAASCNAYVITGSASGVYDGDAWIDTLKDFVRDATDAARWSASVSATSCWRRHSAAR